MPERRRPWIVYGGACVVAAVAGCGTSGASPPATTADAAEAGTDADFGRPSSTYPAFVPSGPQVVAGGGPVMKSARVVPLFYPDDPHQPALVDFVAKLAASPYWSDEVGEYGAGPLSIATPIVLPAAAPASITDADIRAMLRAGLEGGTWGASDAAIRETSVFVLHLPSSTKVSDAAGGASCSDFLGYHESVKSDAGSIIYVVLPECDPEPDQSYTAVLGHELVEAATDPYPSAAPAFLHVADAHLEWELALYGGEIADLCARFADSYFTPPDLGFRIQRAWSNRAMSGFHDPCVPAASGPYFASVPRFDEDLAIDFDGRRVIAKGIALRVGESKTVDVELLSDAPTEGAWEVAASDAFPKLPAGTPSVALEFDRTRGVNGEKVHLTITATSTNPSGGTVVDVTSSLGGVRRHWYGGVKLDP